MRVRNPALLALVAACSATAAVGQVSPESDGALGCYVKSADGSIMYWADPFPGKKKEEGHQAFYFAEAIKKSAPGVGALGQPSCSVGFEPKYAQMYLDQFKHQHQGTFTKIDGYKPKR